MLSAVSDPSRRTSPFIAVLTIDNLSKNVRQAYKVPDTSVLYIIIGT